MMNQRYNVVIISQYGNIISNYISNVSLAVARRWAKLGEEQDAKNGILNVRYSIVPVVKEVRA